MTANDINKYRLTSMEEPTDSQLSTLMKEVAEEARIRSEVADRKYFQEMFEYIEQKKKEWAAKYNITFKNA